MAAGLSFSHKIITSASRAALWARWSNVANWSKWDPTLVSSTLTQGDSLQDGAEGTMVTLGAPGPNEFTVVDCTHEQAFTTTSHVGLGVVSVVHKAEDAEDGKLCIEHEVTFVPTNDETKKVFEKNVWPKLSVGIQVALDSLGKHLEADN